MEDDTVVWAFWRWAKCHDPEIRLKFLKEFTQKMEEE